MTEPIRLRPTTLREPIRSDADAIKRLTDMPLVLYAVAQGAKLCWSILCKRWPELK